MSEADQIFDNQPKVIRPEIAAKLIDMAQETIYDMKYRPQKYGVRREMFLKRGSRLYLRTDILKEWFISRSA
jgi:hypothetical protein